MAIRNKSWSVAKFSCPWRTAVMKGKRWGRSGVRGGVTLLTLLGYLLKLMKCQHASIARVFVMHTEQNINLNSLLKLFLRSSPSLLFLFFVASFAIFFFCWLSSCQRKFGSWQMKSWRDTIWTDAVLVLFLLAICNMQSLDHGLKACRQREHQCGMKHLQIPRIVNWVADK